MFSLLLSQIDIQINFSFVLLLFQIVLYLFIFQWTTWIRNCFFNIVIVCGWLLKQFYFRCWTTSCDVVLIVRFLRSRFYWVNCSGFFLRLTWGVYFRMRVYMGYLGDTSWTLMSCLDVTEDFVYCGWSFRFSLIFFRWGLGGLNSSTISIIINTNLFFLLWIDLIVNLFKYILT